MEKMEHVETFKGAEIYTIGSYRIRIPHKDQYVFVSSRNEHYAEEGQSTLPVKDVIIINTKTGARTTKTMYESPEDIVEILEKDFNGEKKTIKWK